MTASFGDVTAEQRALREEMAVVDDAHGLLWVEGPDAVSFLQGLVSQDLDAMVAGEVRRSFLLGPEGKLRALLWILRGEERIGLVSDAGVTGQVAQDLGHYRIRVKAEIRPDARRVWGLWGPGSVSVLDASDRWGERDGLVLAPIPAHGLPRVLVAGEMDLDAPMAGTIAVTAVRVEAGEPVMHRDVDESTIPQETGLVPESVSFTKGCYLGQELVARIDTRGHVNRYLRGVALTRNTIPPEPSEVWAGDRQVGALTSVSESLRVGAPVGLSLVRREVDPGDEVEIRWPGGNSPAIVCALPMVVS